MPVLHNSGVLPDELNKEFNWLWQKSRYPEKVLKNFRKNTHDL